MLMKKVFTLIATALLLGGAVLPADAVNLYFYKGDSATPVQSADAEKLVFGSTSLTVTTMSNETVDLPYSSWDYFRFDNTSTGITGVTAQKAVLSYDGSQLSLPGSGSIRVYDVAGNEVSASDNGSLSVASLPKGVYVAKAQAGDRTDVIKFVVR